MAKKNKKKKHIPLKKEEAQPQEESQEKHKKEAPDRLSHSTESDNKGENLSQEKSKKRSSVLSIKNTKAPIFLVFIGLAALVFIGYFLFTKLLRPQFLAELLPEQNTIALVEFTVDQTQWNDLKEALKPYPVYDLEKARQFFEQVSTLNYQNDIEPWLGRKAGMALVNIGSPESLQRIYFAESNNHQKTIATLGATTPVTEYQKYPLYQTEKLKGWFTFINNNLVVASSQEALQDFIDSASLPKLYPSETYRKVTNNLPANGAVFVYANLEKSWPLISQLNQNAPEWKTLKPFMQLFKAAGVSVKIEKGRIITQIFTSIDKQKMDGKGFIEYPTKYQGGLLSLANEGTLFFTGGHDVTRELSRLETLFQSGTNASALTFDGLLEGQKEHYFGKDISLKDDIYPVLNGEYLVAVDGTLQKPVFNFFLKLEPDNRGRFDKLLTAFIKTGGIFSPQVKEVTLPDGTKGQEVVAVGQLIKRSDESYNNNTLATLNIGDEGVTAYLAIMNNTLVVSTDKDSLKKIMDRSEGKVTQNLVKDEAFSQNLPLVMKTADETIGLKPQSLLPLIPKSETADSFRALLASYFEPFVSIMVGKNYFEDGISEIYLITLK